MPLMASHKLSPHFRSDIPARKEHGDTNFLSLQRSPPSNRYFYIPARKEHRGVGGIFYDDLSSEEAGFDVRSFTQAGPGLAAAWNLGEGQTRGGGALCTAGRGNACGPLLQWAALRRWLLSSFGAAPVPSRPSVDDAVS